MKVKLAITALFALLVATTLISSVRADVLPTPQSLLLELKETVLEADDWLFRGVTVTNTRQLKKALARKIDATIGLYDVTEHEEAADKLADDIRPKLTDPWDADGAPARRKRACSWLEVYPEGTEEWAGVSAFASGCQAIIEHVFEHLPPGRGIVEFEPDRIWGMDPPSTLSLIFKSYRSFTIEVFNIDYELWQEDDFVESGSYDPDYPHWDTGTVPPYQAVTIVSRLFGGPQPFPTPTWWVFHAVFHTSVGDFPASGMLRVSIL